jgi:bifunctional UDP-N-acetylglucosamine pyrophosphorylase/glucosamine-1-phosphate N-acetyltransferase
MLIITIMKIDVFRRNKHIGMEYRMNETSLGDFTAVILAGGKSKRMMSNMPKPMHKAGGVPMIGLVRAAVKDAGIKRCVVVVGYGSENIMEYLGDEVEYAYQKNQLGTGHALLTAIDYLDGKRAEGCGSPDGGPDGSPHGNPDGGPYRGRLLVLFGDMPLVSKETLTALAARNASQEEHGTLAYADLRNPYGLGRIIRDDGGNFQKIVEQKDTTEEEARISEANVGYFCFEMDAARYAVGKLKTNNSQGEMYLTDMFEILASAGKRVGLLKIDENHECVWANDRAELSEINKVLRKRKCGELMIKSGVTLIDPDATYIDCGVEVGMDTIIYPGCVLEGKTVIGERCEIGPNARIIDSRIGSQSRVQYSVVAESAIGDCVSVGPYAYLRPGSAIGSNARIGDFVEIKNSTIGENVKISHHAYIGDSDVGGGANIGCGVITCNYDGVDKHRTVIGANAFVGSNVNLIAPVKVSDNSYIASGSTITDDVPGGALAIARGRQVVKEGWVSRKGLGRSE